MIIYCNQLIIRRIITLKIYRKISLTQKDVLFENINNTGLIILNRPKQLNALNLSMVNKILPTLVKWEQEKNLVIVKGAGGKALSAGADVKSIFIAKKQGDVNVGRNFFKNEYTMDGIIGTYKIPYVAFMDGIVMGGGVGLSVNGKYKIATERTIFAMPETQIALFPDAGTSYFLSRMEGKLGLFMALTGYRLKGYDTVLAGAATHYIESKTLQEMEKELVRCKTEKYIKIVLNQFSKDEKKEFSLAPYKNKIDKYFSAHTVEDIIQNLKTDESEWAQKNYNILIKMSPTSMKVSKTILERASKLSLLECLTMEYNVAYNTLQNHDFYEGVRALLVDKDQKPKWLPETLEKVSQELIESHFLQAPETPNHGIRNLIK